MLKEGVDADAANAALAEGASWEDFAEQKPIEEVEAGDYALSRPEDDADGQLRFMPVTETYTNTTEEVVELWVVNYATGGHDHLTTTPGHPFWVDTGEPTGEWTFAAELTADDGLRNADRQALTVTSAASRTQTVTTYNFCVAFDHTYYVGDMSIWVHNTSQDVVWEIKDKYPAGSYESRQLRRFVRAWNEEIENAGGSMTRRKPSAADDRASKAWKKQQMASSPARYKGKVVGHTPDAAAGGRSAGGRAMALSKSVNSSVGGQVSAKPVGYNYNKVKVVRPKPKSRCTP